MTSWHEYKHSAPTVDPTLSTATRVPPDTRIWQILYSDSAMPSRPPDRPTARRVSTARPIVPARALDQLIRKANKLAG